MKHFFCSGFNKSGTTFLQMLLDAHPTINCASEQCLNMFLDFSKQLTEQYRDKLTFFDDTTSRQGIRFDEKDFRLSTLQFLTGKMFQYGIDDTITHTGLHDNSISNNIGLWGQLFPESRFVIIVRDPRQVALSLWRHIQRMQKLPDYTHLDTSLEYAVRNVLSGWPNHVSSVLAFQTEQPHRTHIIQYESLTGQNRQEVLQSTLEFLNAAHSEEIIESMFERTSFDALKKKEQSDRPIDQGFFHSGTTSSWKDTLTVDQQKAFAEHAGEEMQALGYL